jgi:drug/metabolite transporter (DMT)-like permease
VTILLGLAAALLWGIPDIPLAVAVRRVGELPVLVGSLAIGLVATVPVVAFIGAPHISGRGLLIAAVTGAVTVVAYLTAFTSFQTCPVSIVTPILSCEGAVAAVIAVAFGERPSAMLGVLLAVAVCGVVLVGMTGGDEGRAQLRGIAFVSLAAVIWGVVLALEAPVSRELGVGWGFVLVRAFTFAFALAFALSRRSRTTLIPSLRIEPWRIATWGIADAGAYGSYYVAAHRGPIALAGVMAAQFAIFASIAGVVFLGERLRRRQWVGVAIVVGAVSGIAALGY